MPSKRTKAVAITPKVRQAVEERDNYSCIFCGQRGRGEAHLVSRAQGGLGVEENIVTVCRQCHNEMDNGLLTQIYREKAEAYLRGIYPDWDRDKYIYKKS